MVSVTKQKINVYFHFKHVQMFVLVDNTEY